MGGGMAIEIKDIPFFRDISAEELALVRECLHEKCFEKGQSLFREGESCQRIFFVKSGRVKLYRMGPGGREQTLETLNAGDTCACNPGSTAWHCSSSAEAVTDAAVWFLSKEHYVNLVKTHANVARSLNRLFAERLQCFSSLIEDISLKDSKKRVVKFLLEIMEENGSEEILSIPFTREEIAQRIGTARETVARQLSDLKKKKLIEIKPRQILILDKEGLKRSL